MSLETPASVFKITTYHTMCPLQIVAKESFCFLRYNAVASSMVPILIASSCSVVD